MVKKKILILIPTNSDKSYCIGRFIKNLNSIDLMGADILFADDSYDNDVHKKIIESLGFEVIKVQKTIDAIKNGENINIVQCLANTRNCLRNEFIKRKKYTHAIWFDSDVIMPEDTIKRLSEHNLDIVTGIYWQRKERRINNEVYEDLYPLIYRYQEKEGYDIGVHEYANEVTVQELFPGRLIGGKDDDIKITAFGTGIFLSSRRIMEDNRWTFRFNPDKPNTTEDMWFCCDIRTLGYNIYADSRVCCRHLMQQWKQRVKNKNNQV